MRFSYKIHVIITVLVLCFIFFNTKPLKALYPEKPSNNNPIRILFYNVENLFDIYDDSTKSDNEFLPVSYKKWTINKFNTKVANLYKVIIAAGEGSAPGIVGLCEIENYYVLHELTKNTPLKKYGYSIIHYDSPDIRGIDVALLYQEKEFELIASKPLRIKLDNQTNFKTRDILYTKGLLFKTDTFHIFVNHWPSRRGGQAKSEEKRIAAAKTLKYHVDSIFNINILSNVIIMGDFNDEADDISISEYLIHDGGNKMVILNPLNTQKAGGTHKYRGKWATLDQFIISDHFLNNNNAIRIPLKGCVIFSPDFLLIDDEKYSGLKPFSTYVGSKYSGGFSDHLPIFFDLYNQ